MAVRCDVSRLRLVAYAVPLALIAAGCGGDDSSSAGVTEAPPVSVATDANADELPNACPVEGCIVEIVGAEASGDEIALTFSANYTPDFERNHIHVFWDSQEPGAVSSDFQQRGFATQGKWHPTDDYPAYTTQADASVSSEFRDGSTTLCVTAADTDHAVIDPSIVDCRDVAELLT